MKKFAFFVCAALLAALTVNAQNTSLDLNKRASRDAAKEAKQYKKEGWIVGTGTLPLERQLDRAYQLQIQLDENGYDKYVKGEAQSIAATYDAAKVQALEVAKQNMAGTIQAQITAIIDNNIANAQLAREQAESIAQTVAASKSLIAQDLGRVMVVVEVYRDKPKKNKEVRVVVFYNAEMALQSAKKAIRSSSRRRARSLASSLTRR